MPLCNSNLTLRNSKPLRDFQVLFFIIQLRDQFVFFLVYFTARENKRTCKQKSKMQLLLLPYQALHINFYLLLVVVYSFPLFIHVHELLVFNLLQICPKGDTHNIHLNLGLHQLVQEILLSISINHIEIVHIV